MDNLENLYRKSFEDFERKPRADFWERLAPIIPPKSEQDNRKLWLFLAYCAGLLSMLLIVLGYQFFMPPSSNRWLASFPVSLEGVEKELLEDSNKELTAKQAFIPIIVSAKPNQSNKAVPSPFMPETGPTIRNTVEKVVELNTVDNSLYSQRLDRSNPPDLLRADFQKSDQTQFKEKAFREKRSTPFLSKDYYVSLQSERPLFTHRKKRIQQRKKGLNSIIEHSFLGIQYIPISQGFLKIANHSSRTSFSQGASINQTNGYDISIGIQFKNNWFFQSGFSNQNYNLNHQQQHAISANYTNAVVLEDGLIQAYTFTGQSLVEPIQQKIEVWSKENDIQNGATFLVQSTIQQQLKFSSIYSQLGYRIRLSPRWQLIPKVGFSALWGEKGKVTRTNLDLLDVRQRLLFNTISNTNKTSFNLIEGLASTELVYRYSKQISFTGTPHFRFGFKPFFNNYQRSTQHRFGQLQLGIRIHLH